MSVLSGIDEATQMVAIDVVWTKIRELAEPLEPIEVSLVEAVGLVLAEPVIADVDLPPFDRAAVEGYAVRAAEATPGTFLRVISPPTDVESEYELEAGESAQVDTGSPLPLGADAILPTEKIRSDSGSGGPRVVEVVEPASAGRHISHRGGLLRSGEVLFPDGTRLTPAMVGLLASQGCVHPLCHRRVRVSIVAVGDHLVGPADAPILHRERNAANLAVSALIQGVGGMVHDLGCVSEAEAGPALDRAMNAPVVLFLGEATGELLRRLARDGVEPVVSGLDLDPCSTIQYGLIRDESGFPTAHLLHLPLDPVAAVIGTALLGLPLISRLQGGTEVGPPRIRATLANPYPEGLERPTAIPVRVGFDDDGRPTADPIVLRTPGDLSAFAGADAIALLAEGSKSWSIGAAVELVLLGGFPQQG